MNLCEKSAVTGNVYGRFLHFKKERIFRGAKTFLSCKFNQTGIFVMIETVARL
jgi:hypothetical protein